MTTPQHPMQPVVVAPDGVHRFKQNAIVKRLLDHGQATGLGLNKLAREDFTDEDHMQLAQLIGYSTSGYGDLSYASPESVAAADAASEALAKGEPPTGLQPAAILPAFMGLPKRKLDELLAKGYRVNGLSIEREHESAEPVRGFITVGGLVGWWVSGMFEREWLRAQHDADSRELRSLCSERDEARRERDALRAKVEGLSLQLLTAERGTEDAAKAEVLYRDAERLLTGDERALNHEVLRLRAQMEALQKAAEHLPWIGHGADWTEAKPVYLVATGEVHEGQETYTRHDAPVPMADQEVLFTRPPQPLTRPAVPEGWKHDCAALLSNDVELWIDACPHCGKPRPALAAAPQPEATIKDRLQVEAQPTEAAQPSLMSIINAQADEHAKRSPLDGAGQPTIQHLPSDDTEGGGI